MNSRPIQEQLRCHGTGCAVLLDVQDRARTVSYILPLRSHRPVAAELLAYLDALHTWPGVAEVLVVDGSVSTVFADFEARRSPSVQHVPVDAALLGLANGKVAGVLTGLRLASRDRLILADDDVRYEPATIAAIADALDRADIVRPQNYFDPLPWHACLDTARTLINRVTGGDWPGTFGLRGRLLKRCGGYDGNVLFENLELVRTIRAAGGTETRPLNLFVRRLPPDASHFWSQRVRQAYDEFARPLRLVFWLSVLPGVALLTAWFGAPLLAVAVMVIVALAEAGRRVGEGARVFPAAAALAAPVWVLERAFCAWLALGARLAFGGVSYAGRRLRRAATPMRTLTRRHVMVASIVDRPATPATDRVPSN